MTRKRHRTLAERLYNANVLPNGALIDIPFKDIVIAKIEKESKEKK